MLLSNFVNTALLSLKKSLTLLNESKTFHSLRYPPIESKVCLFTQEVREGANKRGNSSRLTQSFHFFMFEPIFSPVNALNQPI